MFKYNKYLKKIRIISIVYSAAEARLRTKVICFKS